MPCILANCLLGPCLKTSALITELLVNQNSIQLHLISLHGVPSMYQTPGRSTSLPLPFLTVMKQGALLSLLLLQELRLKKGPGQLQQELHGPRG